MLINENYFDDLEIEDEDIIEDDNDVEEPQQELTLEDAIKLPEQYNQEIKIRIDVDDSTDRNTTFIQTSLLPRLFKRLDAIFELYGIEHSEYILLSNYDAKYCDTIIKFGNYQLFCKYKWEKDEFINDTYNHVYIQVYVNYPKFNYKRAFRFLYTVLNLYRIYEQINWMTFIPITDNDYIIQLNFSIKSNYMGFYYYNRRKHTIGNEIVLCKGELTEEDKREFYRAIFRHFFGENVKKIDYKAIDRDVPFKPFISR